MDGAVSCGALKCFFQLKYKMTGTLLPISDVWHQRSQVLINNLSQIARLSGFVTGQCFYLVDPFWYLHQSQFQSVNLLNWFISSLRQQDWTRTHNLWRRRRLLLTK